MKIVIHTQLRENYGAHDWSGEGECPQHWKNKGGNTYILEGVTVKQAMANELDDTIEQAIEDRNDSYEECIVDSDLVDDLVPNSDFHESWDSPIILTLKHGELHGARVSDGECMVAEITGKRETWVQHKGERVSHVVELRVEDTWMPYSEACSALVILRNGRQINTLQE